MTATQDEMIAELQCANAELEQKLDARTAELHENNERTAWRQGHRAKGGLS
jgi:hypothetical protein